MKYVLAVLMLVCALDGDGQDLPVKLVAFNSSTCTINYLDFRERQERVIAVTRKDGGDLKFLIAARALCGIKFSRPSARVVNNELLLDCEEAPDSQSQECSCCYDLEYTVSGLKDMDIVVRYKGRKLERTSEPFYTYPIKFEISNGDTINYVDKYGRRQGIFRNQRGSAEVHWLHDHLIKTAHYYPNGKIKSILFSDIEKWKNESPEMMDSISYAQTNHRIEYYESGVKKSECHNDDWKKDVTLHGGRCRYWNEKGELIDK